MKLIYSLTTDRQPVIYWETIRLLARFCFDFNTQETMKRRVYTSDVSIFRHYMKINPVKNSDCNRGIYMYFVSF